MLLTRGDVLGQPAALFCCVIRLGKSFGYPNILVSNQHISTTDIDIRIKLFESSSIDYWSRLWVIQEFASAKVLEALYGFEKVGFSVFHLESLAKVSQQKY